MMFFLQTGFAFSRIATMSQTPLLSTPSVKQTGSTKFSPNRSEEVFMRQEVFLLSHFSHKSVKHMFTWDTSLQRRKFIKSSLGLPKTL